MSITSDLNAVGFTAAFATILANEGSYVSSYYSAGHPRRLPMRVPNYKDFRPVQTERVIHSRIGQFNACVKRAQIDNSRSYCANACDLRRSKRAII